MDFEKTTVDSLDLIMDILDLFYANKHLYKKVKIPINKGVANEEIF